MNYKLSQIADIVNGKIIHSHNENISQVLTDSRLLFHDVGSLFIALEGPNHDGHQYIKSLIERGVKSFIVNNNYQLYESLETAGFIVVKDTLTAFQKLASYHRNTFSGKLVAITGSNGKTVVKEWMAQLLAKLFEVSKNPKSYNSQVGVPLSITMMDSGADYHILEAGISQVGEMMKLEKVLKPNEGILTNLGDAHQENFSSLMDKLDEKLILFKNSDVIFFNGEDDKLRDRIKNKFNNGRTNLITWSYSKMTDLRVTGQVENNGNTILSGFFNDKAYNLEIPFSDSASIENIIHIWLFWIYHGLPLEVLQKNVKELEPVAMRLEQKEGQRGCTLINDFYNADLHSLSIAIDLLFNQLPQKKKSIIISDLLQTGLKDDELVLRINELFKNRKFHRVIGVGDLFVKNKSKFEFDLIVFQDTDAFISNYLFTNFSDEAVLLKGARKFQFERISKRLEKQIHNTYVEINMSNLLDNLNFYRSRISSGTKIMVMVKAASYGSGTHEIAKFLAHQRVDYLGVAFADEGIQLREAGIDIPILVMNPGFDSLESIIKYQLEPEIYSFELLDRFINIASREGQKKYPVHIKIDTGMHRLGFQPAEVQYLISQLITQDVVEIQSVFSHLTSADDHKKDLYTHQQAKLFENISNKFRKSIAKPILFHLLNTAGILKFAEYHYDMVRLGIGLYGIDTSDLYSLKPVLSLKSTITQIHKLNKGDTIGYGNSGRMENDGEIAVIPIGYADGYDRRLGNGEGRMICNGEFAPVIGNICMDMSMINITGINSSIGDEVIVIGGEVNLKDIADKLDTIPYEILTRIPKELKGYIFSSEYLLLTVVPLIFNTGS